MTNKRIAIVWLATTAFMIAGCGSASTAADSGQPAPATSTESQTLPPAGFGTLRQDDFTVTMDANNVQVKLTPLEEAIIRLSAPDTYQRLRRLSSSRETRIEKIVLEAGLRNEPLVFLVSFFTRDWQRAFVPTDVQILSRGILYRPLGILPLTPDWGRHQLKQEETQSALYVFDSAIDLEVALQVEYDRASTLQWVAIIRRLESERARVLSRAKS